jgi:hypothetical protein
LNTPVNKLVAAVITTVALSGCGAIQLSAQLACSDNWGRSIPAAERTRANCIDTWTPQELTASLNAQPPGPSGTAPGVRGSPGQVSQVYLPNAGYQITRSGSTVFVNRTSRSK